MRKVVAVAVLLLVAGVAYADTGFSFGFHYSSHPRYYRYYPHYRYYPYPYPYYWWYPSYTVVQIYDPLVRVRCEVKPKDASVLVDGYYAGTVNDYDGFFQRLQVTPGRHTITFRRPGYVPYSVSIYGVRGQDIHIKQQLAPGEDRLPDDERLQRERRSSGHVVPKSSYAPQSQYETPSVPPPEYRTGRAPEAEAHHESPMPSQPGSADHGRLNLRINVAGASVYIDGEFWGVVRDTDAVEIGLAAGSHKIEVVKPGYRTFRQDVSVMRDREAVVEVVLVNEGGRSL